MKSHSPTFFTYYVRLIILAQTLSYIQLCGVGAEVKVGQGTLRGRRRFRGGRCFHLGHVCVKMYLRIHYKIPKAGLSYPDC